MHFFAFSGLLQCLTPLMPRNKLNDAADKRSCKTQIECKTVLKHRRIFVISAPTPPMITPEKNRKRRPDYHKNASNLLKTLTFHFSSSEISFYLLFLLTVRRDPAENIIRCELAAVSGERVHIVRPASPGTISCRILSTTAHRSEPVAHSAFFICPCRQTSCHFDVGTEIVLPFTGRNVLQCAANRKKEPVQQGHDPVQGFFRFFSFRSLFLPLIYEFVPFGQKPVLCACRKVVMRRTSAMLKKTLNDYTLSRSSISMQYIRLPSG